MDVTLMNEKAFTEILKAENIEMNELAGLLIKKLNEKGLRVATAESCTGGLISKLITDEAGASAVFDCGVCSYANFIKEQVLGVSPDTLLTNGAVSPEVALEMAEGIRRISHADIGISTTGIAGPAGGTAQKPVGLIYVGVSTKSKNDIIKAEFSTKTDSRDKNRQLAAAMALYCAFRSI